MTWNLYKRERKANIYQNGENPREFRTELHVAPTNYKEGDEWKVSDTTIIDVPESHPAHSEGYVKMCITAEFHSFFKHNMTDDKAISFEIGDEFFRPNIVAMGYLNIETNEWLKINDAHSAIEHIIGSNTVYYKNLFSMIDVSYRNTLPQLKETITVKSPLDYLPIPEDPENTWVVWKYLIDYNGLDLYPDSSEEPVAGDFYADKKIVLKRGQDVKYKLPILSAVDSERNQTKIKYRVYHEDGKDYMMCGIKYTWLTDPSRVFPIEIDASPETIDAGYDIDCDTSPAFGAPGNILIGWGKILAMTYRTGIDWDTTAIPDAAVITQAQVRLVCSTNDPGDETDIAKMGATTESYVDGAAPADFIVDADGDDYVSASTEFQTVGAKTLTLGGTANADLQAQLAANWFSVGISATGEDGGSVLCWSMDRNGDDPQLIITYVIPVHDILKADYLFEMEFECDWQMRKEHLDYTIDYSTNEITWGGTRGFIPTLENKTRLQTVDTTYEICRASFLTQSNPSLTTKTLFEAIVNDWLRDIFTPVVDVSGASAGRFWTKYVINQSDLLSVLQGVLSVEAMEFRCEKSGAAYKLFLEDSIDPTDWDSQSAAYKAARTFMRGGDTAIDAYRKIITHDRVVNLLDSVQKIIFIGPDDEMIIVRNNESGKVSYGEPTLIMRCDDINSLAAGQTEALKVLNDYRYPLAVEGVELVNVAVEAVNKAFLTTNELVYIKDSILGIDKKFKVNEVNMDMSDDWIVNLAADEIAQRYKVKASTAAGSQKAKYWPDLNRLETGGITGHVKSFEKPGESEGSNIASTNDISADPAYRPNMVNVGPRNKAEWTEPEKEEKNLSLIDTEDYNYTWDIAAENDVYVAIGNSNANPGNLIMQGELVRVVGSRMQYTEPDGTVRKVVHAVFTRTGIAGTSFPYQIKEVGIGEAVVGAMKSRNAFWVPTSAETLANDMPANAVYYPFKWFFKNTKLIVEYVVAT